MVSRLSKLELNGWEKTKEIKMVKKTLKTKNANTPIQYIFVLAGGLQDSGEVHEFVKIRLDKAIELYNQYSDFQQCKIIVMGGGTYHKPPILNDSNYVIHESSSCALYLTEKGNVDPNNIYREWSSYDTIANGYYAYLNYIQPLNINEFILITSEFHMSRAKVIFDYFNEILFYSQLQIHFVETENHGINEDVLHERYKRENNSKTHFENNIVNKIRTINDFSKWFYEEHGAYKSIIYYKIDNKINKSY